MSVVLQKYKIEHEGRIHEFTQLCNAFNFCDNNGLIYPPRQWEKEPQPHIKVALPFAYDVRNNRQRLELERITHQCGVW